MADFSAPLGGLSTEAFLRGYWQKRPLLIRQAIPGFAGLIDKRELFALAASGTSEARLVHRKPKWQVASGPFSQRHLAGLGGTHWTLLLNGLNHHSLDANALLERFSFASWARLDDIMVSYAVDGGGVGAHVDSYDVFLLQGPGRRNWKLMPPQTAPFPLVQGAPLRQIAGFRPTEEMILGPGDMLYLPPGWGHEGTAIGTCQTYSIGFRAPAAAELSAAFLDFLHERGFDDLPYSDRRRRSAAHPAQVDPHLIEHAGRVLNRIRWAKRDVAEFVCAYLSEPKQHVVFDAPERPLTRPTFLRRLLSSRVRLDPRTRMLWSGTRLYVNGTALDLGGTRRGPLQKLADDRELDGVRLARRPVDDLVYNWYREGLVTLEKKR